MSKRLPPPVTFFVQALDRSTRRSRRHLAKEHADHDPLARHHEEALPLKAMVPLYSEHSRTVLSPEKITLSDTSYNLPDWQGNMGALPSLA